MTSKMRYIVPRGLITLVVVFMAGCSVPVLKQDIPVSTNPLGAKIYADGQLMGATPATVSLARNRSHVLTLVKDHYRQEDVVITNRYQKEKVYLNAIQSGINASLFFKSGAMGVGSSMNALSAQEESGVAYLLYPPAVTVNLIPLGEPSPDPSGQSPAGPSSGAVNRGAPPTADDDMQAPPMEQREVVKELLEIGVAAAATQVAPLEKKVATSASAKSYVTPDGTRIQKKSSTSAGVGINPAGLVNVIDLLFK